MIEGFLRLPRKWPEGAAVAALRDIDAVSHKKHRSACKRINQCFPKYNYSRAEALLCELLLFAFYIVTLVELFDTAAGGYAALLTGIERMAFAANVHAQLRFGGAGDEGVAAATGYFAVSIKFRMDFFFHFYAPLFLFALIFPDINASL